MIRNLLLDVTTFLIVAVVIYAASAFGNWDANPANWSDLARGIMAVLVVMFGTSACILRRAG